MEKKNVKIEGFMYGNNLFVTWDHFVDNTSIIWELFIHVTLSFGHVGRKWKKLKGKTTKLE